MAGKGLVGRAERLRRLARAEHAERLLERALAAGLVTSADLESLRAREGVDDDAALLDLLIERGLLAADARDRLEVEEASDLFGALSQPKTLPPPEALEHAADPERNVGELILVSQLGRGGTGAVWRAWDRRLGRWVAVKLATAALESALARDRFSREARATARLSHPNIVPVFQVGTDRGRAYLVMPLVEGHTLAGQTFEVTRALELLRDIARAVDYAHKQGIVHRDIKPGNLMLDDAGRAVVLDFGLAYLREETSSRLTQAGEVLGTASFMAPEQARGEAGVPGPAIDVYGLGATLYALVTGRAPFIGDSLPAVIAQVTNGEPPRPRRLRPDLDARIEAIIIKAMDRDPAARYPSALAFSEDIERVLRGEEVGPGHAGVLRRGVRQLRRRALVFGAAGLSVVAVGTGLARYRDMHAKREAMAALRDVGKLALETALQLRRAGDTSGMRRVLPQLIAAHRRLGADEPVFAEAEYLMGRTYRALLDEDQALHHQARALKVDPSYGPALYERAVLLSQRYGRLRDQAIMGLQTEGWSPNTATEEVERLRPSLAKLRAQVVADCDRLRAIAPSRTAIDAALGILAYHRGDYADARLRLQKVVEADPLREEAWATLALTEAAEGHPEQAEATYDRALTYDRGYAPYQVGRCEVLRLGRPAEAIAAAQAALAMDPGSVAARVCGAGAGVEYAHHQMRLGHDPTGLLDRAETLLGEAIERQNPPAALMSRGILNRYRGLLAARRDGDPGPVFARSIADFTRAIVVDASLAEAWFGRGRTLWYRALHAIERGADGRADLDAARSDFDEATRRAPALATSSLWRAELEGLLGRLAAAPAASAYFDRAESDFARAFARKDDGWSRLVRGTVRTWHGHALHESGGDPVAIFANARADLDRAVARLDPGFSDPLFRRGLLGLRLANHLIQRGDVKGGRAAVVQAWRDMQAALDRDPEHPDALLGRARANELLGDTRAAEADREGALRVQPQRARHIIAAFGGLPP